MSQAILEQSFEGEDSPAPTRVLPEADPVRDEVALKKGWIEESLIDDGGDEIKIRYQGKAGVERYEFIRDYLDFKIKRLAGKSN